jgi:Putative lumazine-binding
MKIFFASILLTLLLTAAAHTQTNPTSTDDAAIKTTALNYIEGWYEGDATRMESALHPELAKRIVTTDPKSGHSQFGHMGAMQLVQNTRRGGGSKTPKEQQQKDVTILDKFNNVAIIKIVASTWVDYLEMAKFNGEWKIINVLWELKPKPADAPATTTRQKP